LGHDPDIRLLPHVPGHELAGTVEEVGNRVGKWRKGDRVTVPFVCACGTCPECGRGNHQICDHQTQPGFTHWGSFAQYVAIHHADVNLVALPDEMSFVTAASLGCRFATSYRAVVAQGGVKSGMWVAVHGCGGVGLSAVMIAASLGARVIAVDIDAKVLKLAKGDRPDSRSDGSRRGRLHRRSRQRRHEHQLRPLSAQARPTRPDRAASRR
jgi:alcohol dehydrogenase